MSTPAPEQIAKLPKWAQDYITNLERKKRRAEKELTDFLDSKTPSPFFEEFTGVDGRQRRYIKADTLTCEYLGVKLTVDAHNYSGLNGPGIRIKWEDPSGSMDEIAFVPMSYQCARLVAKSQMK